ncbi:MAG: hypothetical protein KGQ77_10245, partial [Betaproteobacteria bacterium]|nr:hypothetical protein [Betaproteobacteria bacterium]
MSFRVASGAGGVQATQAGINRGQSQNIGLPQVTGNSRGRPPYPPPIECSMGEQCRWKISRMRDVH